ncbi:MAG: TIGR03936 family radical SAM-associated protein [Bacillota bacterium]|nr:TIGR03936 family radical SAM-associated protein [Bacillota bacterium]
MRYLLKFTKDKDIRFVAHLDIMRSIQRSIKRAGIPIEYSKGFNPHMTMSIAQPLSVGVYSYGEYMDLNLKEELDEKTIMEKFNECSPIGIKVTGVLKIENQYYEDGKKVPQAMAALDGAEYTIKIKYNDTASLDSEMKEMMKNAQWNALKKSKKEEKLVNIRPMVKSLNYKIEQDTLIVNTLVSCGSRENLSAELLAQYITSNTENAKQDSFTDVKREDLYALKNKKMVPLINYFK